MVNERGDLARLEQELRDERARRRDAEGRLEELTRRADLWRSRAEERSERIDRLVAERDARLSGLRRAVNIVRGSDRPASEPAPPAESAPEQAIEPLRARVGASTWPSMKSVLALSLVSEPGQEAALSRFDLHPMARCAPSDFDRADLIVVDPSLLHSLDSASAERFDQWAHSAARQAMLVWTNSDDIEAVSPYLSRGDVVAATDADRAEHLKVEHLPPSFDPMRRNPGVASDDDPDLTGPAAAADRKPSDSRAALSARRWAYRNHAPWVRAGEILDLVGMTGHSPMPRMAGILVSNRPAEVSNVAAAVIGQTHGVTELVVAMHGVEPPIELERLLSEAPIPTEVLTFGSEKTLGECTNLAIAATSAPLLAKVDDDDHYGPAHFEDSFHALAYSGADVVGKATHFAYLSDRDLTVLRRPGYEETLVDGSLNGSTLVFKRSLWEIAAFPHHPRHIDTGFLRAARAVGASTYAGSRWEFCYVRHATGHTWDAEEGVFLAGSEEAWQGFQPQRVEVPDVAPA